MSARTTPTNIFQIDERMLGVDWEDGHRCAYPVRFLRLACTCAGCVHEWTGEKILAENSVPPDVHPLDVETVGRYGVRIHWSDGHSTGIYTFDHLRALCEKAELERKS